MPMDDPAPESRSTYPRDGLQVVRSESWAEPPALREHGTRWTPWIHLYAFVFGLLGAYIAYTFVRPGTLAKRHARAALVYSVAHLALLALAGVVGLTGSALMTAGLGSPALEAIARVLMSTALIALFIVGFMHFAQSSRNSERAKHSLEPQLGWLRRFARPEMGQRSHE